MRAIISWAKAFAQIGLFVPLILFVAGCGGGGGSAPSPANLTVTQLQVQPGSASIAVGQSQTFEAVAIFSNGTQQDVTSSASWSSSDAAIASVNGATASGLSVGSSTISAAYSGQTGSATLNVSAPIVLSIGVAPANPSVAVGQAQQFQATATFSNGTQQDVTSSAAWSSSNAAIASVNGPTATGLSVGSSAISASYSGQSGSATLTVSAPVPVSIAIAPDSPSIAAGQTQQFQATATFSNGTQQDVTSSASWSSSNISAATISNETGSVGVAQAIGVGTTTITATYSGETGSTSLTILSPTVTSLSVTPATDSITKGSSNALKSTATFSDGSTQDVTASTTWTSANTAVATVSTSGLVQAVGTGATTVTAAYSSASGTAAITVSSAYYVPFVATQSTYPSAGTGTPGTFVVPSTAPTAAPIYVSPGLGEELATVTQPIMDANGNITELEPFAIIYLDDNSADPTYDSILALPLDIAAQPAAKQLGSDPLAGVQTSCSGPISLQTNLLDPTSSVVLYGWAGADGTCYTSDDVARLVHYTDSATAAPTTVSLPTYSLFQGKFLALYNNSGQLSGALAVDVNGNLVFFKSLTATSGVTLLTGVSAITLQSAPYSYSPGGTGLIGVDFINGDLSLYNVTDAGTISGNLYDAGQNANFGFGVINSTDGYYYFAAAADNVNYGTLNVSVVRVPANGGAAGQVLATTTVNNDQYHLDLSNLPRVLGFIGSKAILEFNSETAILDSLDTSIANSVLTPIFTMPNGSFSTCDLANNQIFAGVYVQSYPFYASITSYVLDVNGNIIAEFDDADIPGESSKVSGTASPYSLTYSITGFYLTEGMTLSGSATLGGATLFMLSPTDLSTTPILDGVTLLPFTFGSEAINAQQLFQVGAPITGAEIDYVVGSYSQYDAAISDGPGNKFYQITNTPSTDEQALAFIIYPLFENR